MKSIIQDNKECYMCNEMKAKLWKNNKDFYKHENVIEEHHIFFGVANRKLSEKYGLKVWLCSDHHRNDYYAVHRNRNTDLMLKQIAQKKFEETHTRDEFIKIFGRNYL